ncbi:MAG TPA: trypsin-like peptidase domain-containing protein [Bacteroidales bacterium]|nr:trypsin-like peptidase domain-containing protein [Bacteroidales bacterium]
MNKISSIILINLLLTISVFGQIYKPTFSKRDVLGLDIIKIERNSSTTIIFYEYSNTDGIGAWICAGKDFYIKDCETGLKYKLIKANDIPICPEKFTFNSIQKSKEFNLIFENIPLTTKKIDIIESENSRSFNFYGVNLDQSIEFKLVESEAKMRETDSPISDVIYTVPAGTQIKTFSLIGSYYKVEYNGKIGYINEMYFQTTDVSNNNSSLSANNSNNTTFQSNNNYSKIIIHRADIAWGGALRLDIYINDKLIKTLPMNGLLTFKTLEQGKYSIKVKARENGSSDQIEFYLRPNSENYFICYPSKNQQVEIKMSTKDDPQFNPSNINEDRKYEYVESPFQVPSIIKSTWTSEKLKKHWEENGIDQIEGIYEQTISNGGDRYLFGLIKIDGIYNLIYLSGSNSAKNWKEGYIKAILIPTATPLFFKSKWFMSNMSENNDFYISFEQGIMNCIGLDGKTLYIKMYPTFNDNVTSISNVSVSGTGFAITSNGLIVTNNHVIEGAKTIKVRGINGDFSRAYSAKLITTDKNNDLAIIKIDDYSFSSLGNVPYIVKSSGSNVGENIFVLGYPLRASMGDEIKLTNGIISSKTGFQGDVTSYQISAPVQPGNSGGPLFDSQGYLIGIINAKHVGAENASYAVKVSYLTNLIDLLDFPPTLQKVSSVSGKPLTQQVTIIKKFVYIIEVN